MASGLASFNARRNVRAPAMMVSTIQGSSITTASITTGTLSLSTLTGSTITSNMLSLSTLTVSSINSGAPGVAAYSTFNASSINTSSITVSSITTAPGYNSNISNVIYTSLADSGQTAANLITTGMPATAPSGTVISGSYRATSASGEARITMRLAYTFVIGTTYTITFTGMQGSTDLGLRVYQYNPAGNAYTQIDTGFDLINTTAKTISGSFTPSTSGVYTGTIIFFIQALSYNPYVNFTSFSMTAGSMNVGIGMSNPIAKLQINQDGNSTANELGSHSLGILSSQGTSGTNRMYMMMDADFTNQCCSIQSIIYGLTVWNLNLNPRGGNVGIGTTNPGAVLHVYDSLTSATSVPLMLFSPNLSAGGIQYLYFGTANSANNSAQIGWTNVGAGSASNYAFIQIYGKANIMTWKASTGYVGIGTTNPTASLHVVTSTTATTSGILSERYYLSGPGDNQDASGTDYDGPWYGLGWSGIAGLSGNPYVCLAGYAGVAMRSGSGFLQLTSAGNVGMGTTNPTGNLEVFMANSVNDFWRRFKVKTTSFWGDGCTTRSETAGTQYATVFPIMFMEPHVVSNSAGDATIRLGRAGGIQSGKWWDCGTLNNGNFRIGLEASNTGITINGSGFVGINNASPAYALDVAGASNFGSRISIGGNSNGQLNINNINGGYPYTHFNWTDGLNYIRGNTVFDTNWVSIGTAATFCPLYITSYRDHYWYLSVYMNWSGVPVHNNYGTWPVSIWTEHAIVTNYWFGTVSDQRIKKNIQPIGTMLETINKIEIVSFDFIDSANNKRDECGVIAQQLETVFPNAVDTSAGFIPCYLKFATSQHLVNDDVHILFDYDHTDTQQQFKVGDKIKINAGQKTDTIEKNKGSHHVVVKSMIDGGFVIEKWKDYEEDDSVFLYGKEVNDFRNVDKEQLGILALKGVQELSSMVSTLQTANTQLESQVSTLSASMAGLSASYASLLARLEALEAR